MAKDKNGAEKYELHYQATQRHNPKLAIYKDGVDRALKGVLSHLPKWLGEATILRIRNGVERMKIALDNNDAKGADELISETMKVYDQNTLIPIGYAWKGSEIEKEKPEEKLERALEKGAEYSTLKLRLEALDKTAKETGELERRLAA
ncbi:MAG: hypothetical protein AABX08_04595 [Nanoarchaeota archaeon]